MAAGAVKARLAHHMVSAEDVLPCGRQILGAPGMNVGNGFPVMIRDGNRPPPLPVLTALELVLPVTRWQQSAFFTPYDSNRTNPAHQRM